MFLVDLDGDGRTEKIVSYTFQNKGVLYDIPSYGLGVAVLRGEAVIAVTPPEIRMYPETRLVPIQISNDTVGLLYHVTTTTGGSGIYPHIYRKILILQDDAWKTIWEWDYFGGARAGAAYRQFTNEKIELKYLTGKPYADIFISRQSEGWQLTGNNPANYLNYGLHFPGGLVFSWDGEEYKLSHYYDGKELVMIRPADLITHAPYISEAVTYLDAMRQIEYKDALIGYGLGSQVRSVEVNNYTTAWDRDYFYVHIEINSLQKLQEQASIIWVGIDTNLSADFDSHTLSVGDYLFKVEISELTKCEEITSTQLIYPYSYKMPIETTLANEQFCLLDFAIPRTFIQLDDLPVQTRGTVLKHADNFSSFSLHEYFPQSGKVIGFAVFSQNSLETILKAQGLRDWFHPLSFDPQDPTTWGTLIFMSDQ